MKLGLHIGAFAWPGGDAAIGEMLGRIVRTADDAGFDSIWVMDHFFQIGSNGKVEDPMLEGTTALGFMAAHSERARLGSEAAFDGQHYQARRIMNSPQALSEPHPPILIGGGGERRTLRLVAKYADACNVFGTKAETLEHKFGVLRRHCDGVGRDYETIERTNLTTVSVTRDGARRSLTPDALIDRLAPLADVGLHHAIISVRGVSDVSKLELIGRDVIPRLREIGPVSPLS